MPGCDKEVEVVYDNDGPIIDKPVRPIRVSRIETQWNGYMTFILENLKESEAWEVVDILKARKYLD